MKPIAFLLSSCLLLGSAAAGSAMSGPEQLQTDAYVQVVQGDQSFEAGRLDEALGQYQDARRLYEQLAAEFPSWEPRIVRYRAAYCDNRIAEINQRVGERAAETSALTAATATAAYYGSQPDAGGYDTGYAPAPAPVPVTAGVPESLYQSALRRADSLQAQLDSARNAEQQARAELARVRTDLDRANRSLSQRSVEADSELARLRDLQGRQQNELQVLRAENERLKVQLASKADLEGALNDAESQLNRVRGENRELQEQLADLHQDLEDCEARVAQAADLAVQAQAEAAAQAAAVQQPEEEPEPPEFDPAAFAWPEPQEPAEDEDFADDDSIPEITDDDIVASIDANDSIEAPAPAAPAERVVATWPPRPIPRGMEPADFVRVLLANGETETAFATVQKAREDAPDDVALATLEGIVLIRLQHYAAAAELLHALSVDHPDDAAIHANLGAAWIGEGFYAGARAALQNAIDLNPDIGGEYYYNLALVCAMTEPRDIDTARDAYRKALAAGVAPDPQLDALLP